MKILSYKQSRIKFLFEKKSDWVKGRLNSNEDKKWVQLYKEWCKDNSFPSLKTIQEEYENYFIKEQKY